MTRSLPTLAILGLVSLLACSESASDGAPSPSTPRPKPTGTAVMHLLEFNKLQGFGEGFPCDPDALPPLVAAGELRRSLHERGDAALLVAIGDTLSRRRYEPPHKIQAVAERARRATLLEALGAAGLDLLVPGHADLRYGPRGLLEQCERAGIPVLMSNASVPGSSSLSSYVFEHRGVRIALLGLLPPFIPDTKGNPIPVEYQEVELVEPGKAVRELLPTVRGDGEVDLVVVLSNLQAQANRDVSRIPGVDIIIGSAEPGDAAGVVFDPSGEGALMMTSAHNARELGHTTFAVVEGSFAFSDVSGLYVLPRQVERDRARLAQFVARFGTTNLDRLALEVSPEDTEAFVRWAQLIDENAAAVERMRAISGSTIAHRPAELPRALGPGSGMTEVRGVLDRVGEDILATIADADIREPIEPPRLKTGFTRPDECVGCHVAQYEFWAGTRHAHAYETLREHSRHMDATCVNCHTTGYNDPAGYYDLRREAPFGPVSCFSCHGTNPKHSDDPLKVMDPAHHFYGSVDEMSCTGCHNDDRSPEFDRLEALSRVACPEMTGDEAAIVATYRRVLDTARERRSADAGGARMPFFEARALIALGQTEPGVEKLTEFAPLALADPELAINVARSFEEASESHLALQFLLEFLEHATGEPRVNAEYVRLLLEASDPDARDPEAALRRVRFLLPEGTTQAALDFRVLEVDALYALGRDAEGRALLERLLTDHRTDARVLTRSRRYGVEPL